MDTRCNDTKKLLKEMYWLNYNEWVFNKNYMLWRNFVHFKTRGVRAVNKEAEDTLRAEFEAKYSEQYDTIKRIFNKQL